MSTNSLFLTNLISVAAVAQSWAVQTDRVHELSEKAIVVIRESNDDKIQARLLSDVALLRARNHEEELSYEIFAEALGKVPIQDFYNQFSDIAENQAKAGFYDDALRSGDVMRRDKDDEYGVDETDTCFSSIALAMARRGDVDLARATCAKIQQDLWRSRGLAELAAEFFKRGDKETAQLLVKDATTTANAIAGNQRMLAFEVHGGNFHERRNARNRPQVGG